MMHNAGRIIGSLAVAAVLAAATSAAAQTKVRIALGETGIEAIPYYIALERAKAKGVDFEATNFSKEDLSIQAVVGGQADLGIATPYAVIQKSKAPIRGLMQISRLVFFPVADKSLYKDWKALNGQPFVFHDAARG